MAGRIGKVSQLCRFPHQGVGVLRTILALECPSQLNTCEVFGSRHRASDYAGDPSGGGAIADKGDRPEGETVAGLIQPAAAIALACG